MQYDTDKQSIWNCGTVSHEKWDIVEQILSMQIKGETNIGFWDKGLTTVTLIKMHFRALSFQTKHKNNFPSNSQDL